MNSFSSGKTQKSLVARTTHLITGQLKHWLPSKIPALNYSIAHRIRHSCLYARQMAGWKTMNNNCSTTVSERWRNAGPSAFQLQVSMLKSDKRWCAYLVVNCVSLRTFWTPLVQWHEYESRLNKFEEISYLVFNCVSLQTFWMPLIWLSKSYNQWCSPITSGLLGS